jgi:RNA polymerase sigma-70 factor (ECF subfamily)
MLQERWPGCFEDQLERPRDIGDANGMAAPLSSLGWDSPADPDATRDAHASAPSSAADRRQRLAGWFVDHFDTLWRLAARLGVPSGSVDDVVQEAFITAERKADEIDRGSARAFLIGTTVRLCANQRRRQRTRAEYAAELAQEPGHEAPADAEQLMARKQLRVFLDMALDELPPEQRTVLVLHEVEGFSVAEIAELLADRPGTVASRLGRARSKFSRAAARLRAEWQQHR